MRTRRTLGLVGAAVLAQGMLASDGSAERVLHEYFDFNAVAVQLHAQPGLVGAGPIPTAEPFLEAPGMGPPAQVLGVQAPVDSDDTSFRLDADTSQPGSVSYDDPFQPSVAPFKRVYAFDGVNEELELVVANPALHQVPIEGIARPEDDQFYVALDVPAGSSGRARIPTPGPSARILQARLTPEEPFQILEDSAGNRFVESGGGRLVMHLAVARAAFGGVVRNPTWGELRPLLPPLPVQLEPETRAVRQELGLDRGLDPSDALRRLVAHFRSFEPSDDHPRATGAALYRTITLARKGVCRHRSFGFVLTALALGIPARFVHNEAHAWVEVFDGVQWQRVDLGGAAGNVNLTQAINLLHAAPDDTYPWPVRAQAGQDLIQLALSDANGSGATGALGAPDGPAKPGEPAAAEPGTAASSPPDEPALGQGTAGALGANMPTSASLAVAPATGSLEPKGASRVHLVGTAQSVVRGQRLAVQGSVHPDVAVEPHPAACDLVPIDVFIVPTRGAHGRHLVGALVTDATGHFEGQITIPRNTPVGDYALVATSQGSPGCAPGISEESPRSP